MKITLFKNTGADNFEIVCDGVRTGAFVPSLESGNLLIQFLYTLSDKQVQDWLNVYQPKETRSEQLLLQKLKSSRYSGRTTAYEHKSSNWKDKPDAGPDCISIRYILEAQWSNMPIELEKEIQELWIDNQYGNDDFYFSWDNNKYLISTYPLIHAYLNMRGVDSCLIHWWW